MSLSRFKESSKLKPVDSNAQEPQMMIWGSDSLPASIFGKEKSENGDKASTAMRTDFVKMYSYNKLGEKLKMLRLEKKKETWFSLQERNERLTKLREIEKESERNDRLTKLREIEEKESEARIGGVTSMKYERIVSEFE
ncbi:S15/NS1 [Abeliophyllum distichum]|uniref:S15/NS1 n=1 Tax=Abeliophyllum distichum TaxID=126358 RepID=A0ABD1QUU3_9LAMI